MPPERRRRTKRITRSQSLDTDVAVAFGYKPTFGTVPRNRTIQIIRRDAKEYADFDPSTIIVVRGKGGTKDYPSRWWSSPRMEASEIEDLTDDELRDIMYGLGNPTELDIYARIR